MAGLKMLLRGFNQHLRQVAMVNANGQFSFSGVIPDTYQLTLNDLAHPNVVSSSAVIFPNTTMAQVSIVYPLGIGPTKAAASASLATNHVKQNVTPPPARLLLRSGRQAASLAPVTQGANDAVSPRSK
ncbi:hypothetical protein [Rugamonas apoptosis]|uniref:Carboxypeptidase regulatory-like domain-containing protein n=1 Tax=Rugamonas apoptosis TaxID=2758570 RepID=A0A7W2F6U6_9BURK|nr:hypothetical protein [Rugamonas apoptosis]MBA5686168.1 hypothetical protein [Rugamonas apoptosis]